MVEHLLTGKGWRNWDYYADRMLLVRASLADSEGFTQSETRTKAKAYDKTYPLFWQSLLPEEKGYADEYRISGEREQATDIRSY